MNKVALDAWNAAHPKGTKVIVLRRSADREFSAHGRTTTKAHLKNNLIMVRVQYHGGTPWVDVRCLSFVRAEDALFTVTGE